MGKAQEKVRTMTTNSKFNHTTQAPEPVRRLIAFVPAISLQFVPTWVTD